MTYPFSFGFVVTDGGSRPITGVDLDKTVDALMEAMLELETDVTYDSSVGAALSSGEVDVDLEVSAQDEGSAAVLARDFVMESIRAIGGTPIGIFTFPKETAISSASQLTPRQEWHERKAELASA